MPFDSEKQRRFLWANKPEVAKQIAHKDDGGMMMDNRKPSKVTKKDRYGNQVTYEYAPDTKPLDPTALAKHAMDQGMEVPEISMMDIDAGHPGEPQGSDTVPAWLTPGEFVVNAEAMRIPGAKETVESINNQGRAMQQMQGGSIPSHYNIGGQIPFIAGPRLNEPQYQDDGGWITDELLDRLAFVESSNNNDAVSKAGAVGKYQWLPSSAKKAGYGVKAFDPKDEKAARAATAKYLKNMQKYHGFTPEETLRAYNWGPGNVLKHKRGARKDIPAEALNYPGKILGFDKVEGVPAPVGMPVPIARPEELGIPEAMPIPRPTQEEMPAWKSFMNKYILGDQTQYKQEGGQIKNPFPPGTYAWEQFEKSRVTTDYRPEIDYRIPESKGTSNDALTSGLFNLLTGAALGFDNGGSVPSNVVPALTDVPKGHKMFGGDETFAGTVNAADPNLVDDLSGSTTGEVVPTDEGAGNVPWYAGLLGPKSKEMLDIPLEGEDKEFLDKQTAVSDKLAGPELAEEENLIADGFVDQEVLNQNMEDEIIKEEINEIKKDDKKKGEFAGKVSQDTAEIDAKKTGEVQTGPDKNQPGENKSEEEVVAKGESAGKGVLNAAKDSLLSAFGDLFDKKELGRMAILYAGSRLLGYSHGGSLQYASKQYLTRVDAKNANHQKYVQELTKSGKYSTKSIAAYNKSKDINDLVPKGEPVVPTGQFKTFYGPNGQKIRATQVKIGKATVWRKPDGTVINSSYHDSPETVPGTKEFADRVRTDSKQYEGMITDLRGQFGTKKIKDGVEYATELAPSVTGNKIARWAAENRIPADQMGAIVENAYHSAILHSQNTGEKVRDLEPFLNNQWVIAQTGDASLFTNAKGQTVKGPSVSKLFGSVRALAKEAFGKDLTTTQAVAGYRIKWNELSEKEQKLWNDKAYGDEETGFMKFIENDLIKLRTGA